MDLVYLVGPEAVSKHNNQELMWSLRSVAKYARNVGRVIVAGYPPEWLSSAVVRVPVEDRPGDYKFWCIWRKLFAAIDAGVVSGEFLVSGDDYFYTRETDLESTPFYYRRRGILPFEEMKEGGGGYRKHLAATRELLVRNGYPARDCAGHCCFRVDTADAKEVARIAGAYGGANRYYGFDPASCFINVRSMRQHIDWTFRKDWKCTGYVQEAVDCGQFSIGDEAFGDPVFLQYMAREFGSPCRYELEGD